MAKSKQKMVTVQVAVVRKSVIGFLKYHSRYKKKHYGKINVEDGNCPSGGRKEKCHWNHRE